MTNEEAIEICRNIMPHRGTPVFEALDLAIKALEQQPKTGHWIEKEDYNLDIYYECSECGADYCIEGDILIHKYCPNCGCEMTEKMAESEDKE